MKAKEYFEKFQYTEDFNPIVIYQAFNDEAIQMLTVRGNMTNEAVQAIITEQNDKWNGLCRLYVKKYGFSRIGLNGFRNFWIRRIKEARKDSVGLQ